MEINSCSIEGGPIFDLPSGGQQQTFTTRFTLTLNEFNTMVEVAPFVRLRAIMPSGRSVGVRPAASGGDGAVSPGGVDAQQTGYLLGLLPGTHTEAVEWEASTLTGRASRFTLNLQASPSRAIPGSVTVNDQGNLTWDSEGPSGFVGTQCGQINVEDVDEPPLGFFDLTEPTTVSLPERGEQASLMTTVTNPFSRPVTVSVRWYFQQGGTIATATSTVAADSQADVQQAATFNSAGTFDFCAEITDATFADGGTQSRTLNPVSRRV